MYGTGPASAPESAASAAWEAAWIAEYGALPVLADGWEIDYEGASASMDWDGNGDLRRGDIVIWRFTGDERIKEVRAVAFGK